MTTIGQAFPVTSVDSNIVGQNQLFVLAGRAEVTLYNRPDVKDAPTHLTNFTPDQLETFIEILQRAHYDTKKSLKNFQSGNEDDEG